VKTSRVDVILDAQLRTRLEQFRDENGFQTTAGAARALLTLGLTNSNELPLEWRRITAREAGRVMSSKIRHAVSEVLSKTSEDARDDG